jgi:hypothetical protein
MRYILDLEKFILYELATNYVINVPKGILFHNKCQAIEVYKEFMKKKAEFLYPKLIGIGLLNEICLVDGEAYNVYRHLVQLNGGEKVSYYKRWIDVYREIIFKHQKCKDHYEKLFLTYIKIKDSYVAA